MALIEPFNTILDMQHGTLQPAGQVIQRRLSDMRNMYFDRSAYERILAEEGDRLIYEVYNAPELPKTEGQLLHCTTLIHPGQVGQEFHMTKGHFHAKRDRAEVYVGLSGEGHLLLQAEDGTVRDIPIRPGTVAYIPPLWAHRTVNTGDQPFSFLSVWPGDAGHDYGSIEKMGFAKLLLEQEGQAVLIDNPKFYR
jgi:glucose-6-phosphate isomerase